MLYAVYKRVPAEQMVCFRWYCRRDDETVYQMLQPGRALILPALNTGRLLLWIHKYRRINPYL